VFMHDWPPRLAQAPGMQRHGSEAPPGTRPRCSSQGPCLPQQGPGTPAASAGASARTPEHMLSNIKHDWTNCSPVWCTFRVAASALKRPSDCLQTRLRMFVCLFQYATCSCSAMPCGCVSFTPSGRTCCRVPGSITCPGRQSPCAPAERTRAAAPVVSASVLQGHMRVPLGSVCHSITCAIL
jgi:hypothetical protein